MMRYINVLNGLVVVAYMQIKFNEIKRDNVRLAMNIRSIQTEVIEINTRFKKMDDDYN